MIVAICSSTFCRCSDGKSITVWKVGATMFWGQISDTIVFCFVFYGHGTVKWHRFVCSTPVHWFALLLLAGSFQVGSSHPWSAALDLSFPWPWPVWCLQKMYVRRNQITLLSFPHCPPVSCSLSCGAATRSRSSQCCSSLGLPSV